MPAVLPAIHEVYPYLIVRGAAAAIEFYREVFGAVETMRMADPDGRRIGHAELRLGPVTIMLADEYPELDILSPEAFGGTGLTLHLHVDDVDSLAERAVRAGATMVRAPTDYDHGERQCRVRDPFGHEWLLGHAINTAGEQASSPSPKSDAPNVFPGLRSSSGTPSSPTTTATWSTRRCGWGRAS